MTPEQDEFRRRAIRAVLMVAGIAVVVGLVVGLLTAGAMYVSGILPTEEPPEPPPTVADAGSDEEDSLPSPSLSPTTTPSPEASPSSSPSASARNTPTPSAKPSPTRSRRPEPDRPITLRASTSSAGSFERVTLSGSYPGGNGTSLQVQRREGGSWVPFPTSATVSGGTFSTYVASGQPGPNAFRAVDPSTGRSSNVVVVTVS